MSISGTVVCKKRAGERSAEENSQKSHLKVMVRHSSFCTMVRESAADFLAPQ